VNINLNDEVSFWIRSRAIEGATDNPFIKITGKRINPDTTETEYRATAQLHRFIAWAGPLMESWHCDGSPIGTEIEARRLT
jgi:hypothetical protein